jgi:hypothetical protein
MPQPRSVLGRVDIDSMVLQDASGGRRQAVILRNEVMCFRTRRRRILAIGPEIGTEAGTGVVDENRCGPREHIVRVLRDPSQPAFSQVKRYSAVR